MGAKEKARGNLLRAEMFRSSETEVCVTQNVNLIDNCTWRGSPTPCRRKPLKSNRLGAVREFWFPQVERALIRLSLLKVLNISTVGISAYRSPNLNGRDSRQSNETYSLSFRNVFRLAHGGGTNAPGFAGCAEGKILSARSRESG